MMKTFLLVLAVAGLSGCAVYPAAPYETYGSGSPYDAPPPVYLRGGAVYQYDYYHPAYPQTYQRPYRDVVPLHAPRPPLHPPHPVVRDRDRDGIPDHRDRDRDGDGVPNRLDRKPDGKPGVKGSPERNDRDRDREPLPRRLDRDADGDGAPDRSDRWPTDSRRR